MSSYSWLPSYIIHAESVLEVSRRVLLNQLVTQHLGGLFPQGSSANMKTVLDIECGAGGWVLDAVAANPHLVGVGVDINAAMIQYANMLALAENVQATFHCMDVMKSKSAVLLPSGVFEYINTRFLRNQVYPLCWNVLLRECWRLLSPRGILHLTEFEYVQTNSVALNAFFSLFFQALIRTHRSLAARVDENRKLFDACLTWCDFEARGSRHFVSVKYHPQMDLFTTWRETFFLTFASYQPFLIQSGMITVYRLHELWAAIERDMNKGDFFVQITLSSLRLGKPAREESTALYKGDERLSAMNR